MNASEIFAPQLFASEPAEDEIDFEIETDESDLLDEDEDEDEEEEESDLEGDD